MASYVPQTFNNEALVDNSAVWAQSFTPSETVSLDSVDLFLRNMVALGSQANDLIFVRVEPADSRGLPSLAIAAASGVASNQASQFVKFDLSGGAFGVPPVLQAGQTYWITADNSRVPTDGYAWGGNNPGDFAGGGSAFNAGIAVGWQTSAADLIFRVWGCDPPPAAGGGAQSGSGSTSGGSGKGSVKNTTLSALSVVPTAFEAAPSGPSIKSAKKKGATGTRVSYTLSQASSVRFTVQQPAKGRRVKRGKKLSCVKPNRKNRKSKKCKRVESVGGFTVQGSAGKNSFRFMGRVSGRKLRPGKYSLVGRPQGGGIGTTTGFRILR